MTLGIMNCFQARPTFISSMALANMHLCGGNIVCYQNSSICVAKVPISCSFRIQIHIQTRCSPGDIVLYPTYLEHKKEPVSPYCPVFVQAILCPCDGRIFIHTDTFDSRSRDGLPIVVIFNKQCQWLVDSGTVQERREWRPRHNVSDGKVVLNVKMMQ